MEKIYTIAISSLTSYRQHFKYYKSQDNAKTGMLELVDKYKTLTGTTKVRWRGGQTCYEGTVLESAQIKDFTIELIELTLED